MSQVPYLLHQLAKELPTAISQVLKLLFFTYRPVDTVQSIHGTKFSKLGRYQSTSLGAYIIFRRGIPMYQPTYFIDYYYFCVLTLIKRVNETYPSFFFSPSSQSQNKEFLVRTEEKISYNARVGTYSDNIFIH